MRLFYFMVLSVIYAVISTTLSFVLVTQCGMGPDSPIDCNERGDELALIFNFGAMAAFLGLSFIYWRRRDAGVQ